MTRRTLLFLILAITVTATTLRILVLLETEPRYDQAFFAWWIRSIASTSHIWPQGIPGASLFEALKSDGGSLLHQLFRNLYNKPISLLTLVPLGVIGGVAGVIGDSYAIQTGVSILWATLLLPLLGGFAWWGMGDGAPRPATGLLALALGAVNPNLFWFSPMGIHNFGMVGLLAAIAASEARRGARLRGRDRACGAGTEAGLHVFALYSHWTNAFILPAARIAAFLLEPGPVRCRIRAVMGYAAVPILVGLSLAPLAALDFIRPAERQTFLSLATIADLARGNEAIQMLRSLLAGSSRWLEMAETSFTWVGTAGALAGLGLLWRRGIRIPGLVVLVHFIVFTVMSGFSGAALRVFPYVLPLFCLGLAECLMLLVAWRRLVALTLLATHLVGQVPPLLSPAQAEATLPEFWHFYYQGQGELRPMIHEMDQAIPSDGVLLSWSYGLFCVHEALRDGPPIAAVLDGLWLRYVQGNLADYLALRPKILARRVFLITEDAEQAILAPPLAATVPVLLGPEGLALMSRPQLVPVRHWTLSTSTPGNATLWEVVEGKEG